MFFIFSGYKEVDFAIIKKKLGFSCSSYIDEKNVFIFTLVVQRYFRNVANYRVGK